MSSVKRIPEVVSSSVASLPTAAWLWYYLGLTPNFMQHIYRGLGQNGFFGIPQTNTFAKLSSFFPGPELPWLSSLNAIDAEQCLLVNRVLWQKMMQWQLLDELDNALSQHSSQDRGVKQFQQRSSQALKQQIDQARRLSGLTCEGMGAAFCLETQANGERIRVLLSRLFLRLEKISLTELEKFCTALVDGEEEQTIDGLWASRNEKPYGALFRDALLWECLAELGNTMNASTRAGVKGDAAANFFSQMEAFIFANNRGKF